jgi:hypothetical protein
MIDNLVIDRKEQTCYLKYQVGKEKLPETIDIPKPKLPPINETPQ